MKIPNLTGQNYETILFTVRGIMMSVKRSDEQARENGELLKYVVEIYDENDLLNEVKEMYSKHFLFPFEISRDLEIGSRKHEVRGPFPLSEGALADSKLNRWELEKEKEKNDSMLIEKYMKMNEEKQYKYAYIISEEVMGVKRFVELTFSDSAIKQSQIDKLLRASSHRRNILRIKLSDKTERLYQ